MASLQFFAPSLLLETAYLYSEYEILHIHQDYIHVRLFVDKHVRKIAK
jgi:hypothetical protein